MRAREFTINVPITIDSPVIDKLTQDHTVGTEPVSQDDILTKIKALMSK